MKQIQVANLSELMNFSSLEIIRKPMVSGGTLVNQFAQVHLIVEVKFDKFPFVLTLKIYLLAERQRHV